MILMIDNYDSFTYNLVQLFQKLGQEVVVRYNDAVTIDEIEALAPEALIISPGPCTPMESGVCIDAVHHFTGKMPILGVCLGHQVIGHVFGAQVVQAPSIIHGKTDCICHEDDPIFKNIPSTFTATRYHSLVVEGLENTTQLTPLGYSDTDHVLMAMKHHEHPVYGVQFHPESYASQYGMELAQNFVDLYQSLKEEKPC